MAGIDINSEIRPFWMPNLNAVVGTPTNGLASWIYTKDYQIYQPIGQSDFRLYISNADGLLNALAHDCNRFAGAAFESMYLIKRHDKIQKSISWLIIKSYYAAFFAGHAILRMLGISCSQLEMLQVNEVVKVARNFGMDNGITLPAGFYECTYDRASNELFCKKAQISTGGSHEAFWKIFLSTLRNLSNNILASSSITTNSQQVALLLNKVCTALCYQGRNGGNWLSYVRNVVNYRHELSCWFPYKNVRRDSIDKIYTNSAKWENNPAEISLNPGVDTDLNLFNYTCTFIVGLCRSLILDMYSRCPRGESYLSDGCVRLLNTIGS